jgi:hypothetical protein
MNYHIDELRQTIGRVRRRRAFRLTLREVGLDLACMAALCIALGLLETVFEFRPAGRFALLLALAGGAGALVVRHLHARRRIHADDQRIAHYIEEHVPELEQRLITSMEFGDFPDADAPSMLVEKLWEDTRMKVTALSLDQAAAGRTVCPAAGAAVLMIGCLVLALWNWSDFSKAGRRIILPWAGQGEAAAAAVILTVEPGTIRIQRGNDVLFVARIENAAPQEASLYLQTDQADWQRVGMKREGGDHTYVYFLPSVNKDVIYYVDIGVKRSNRHRIAVFDRPRVELIALEYEYPEYTGLQNKSVRNGGDVIAPEGTRITLRAAFNKTIAEATVLFGDGTALALEPDGKTAGGSFVVTQDATYTIQVIDTEHMQNEDAYEYFVQAIPDVKPTVTLVRPGRDRRVMSLEEVSIAAQARDDYGLAKFGLNYMVAGGPQREVPFLKTPRQELNLAVDGQTTLYLEDLEVKPGDFILYYLTAVDNNDLKGPAEVVSDIYFLEVVPTAEEFRRAGQQGGGGGGSGGQGRPSSALVQNQKNIIAATWKLLQQGAAMPPRKLDENVETIAASQRQVMERTQLSLLRLRERFTLSDKSYDRAVKYLEQAAGHMQAAVEKLTSRQLEQALGPEQAALQAIMKAESESRRTMIQVARSRSGGNAGSAQQERQDLRELFEMEMGRLENRYELPQQAAGMQQDSEEEDTLAKLRDLARRQERLNRAQTDLARRRKHMTAEQKKRRLEQLRREQEELSRQAHELTQRMSQLARRDGLRQWSDRRQQLAQTTRQMQEAARSLAQREPDSALAGGRQALENLRDQEREMGLERRATVSNLVNALSRKAKELESREKQILKGLEDLQPGKDNPTPPPDAQSVRQIRDLLAGKDKLQRDLAEAQSMLRAIEKKGRQEKPEIAGRAAETRRSLETEGIPARIEESRELLQQGWLSLSMDLEKRIDQSVGRVSKRLQELERPAERSRDEKIRQAAADAEGLRRELENLEQQIEALRQSNRNMQRALSSSDQSQSAQPGTAANDGGQALVQLQQGLQRSRRYAQGLVQPWARGERWGVDARWIQRRLTQQEIEDFLSQPDLWQRLLEPARELEETLQAEANAGRLDNKLFTVPDDKAPADYQHLVEEYYRNLSRVER